VRVSCFINAISEISNRKYSRDMSSKKSKKKSHSNGMNRTTRDMLTLNGNPIWRALSKVPISEKSKISIGLSGRKSLYALTNGAGVLDHCKDLLLTAFAGIYLAEQGYGADLMDDFTAALATSWLATPGGAMAFPIPSIQPKPA